MEVAHRLAMGEPDCEIRDVRNTAIIVKEALHGWSGVDSTVLMPRKIDPIPHPYGEDLPCADNKPVAPKKQEAKAVTVQPPRPKPWEKTYVLLPSFEKVRAIKCCTPMLAYSAPRNQPGCPAIDAKTRRPLCVDQPPAIPLSTEEMDSVFALPYKRVLHPAYGNAVFRLTK